MALVVIDKGDTNEEEINDNDYDGYFDSFSMQS